jgi:hypothetical protein
VYPAIGHALVWVIFPGWGAATLGYLLWTVARRFIRP